MRVTRGGMAHPGRDPDQGQDLSRHHRHLNTWQLMGKVIWDFFNRNETKRGKRVSNRKQLLAVASSHVPTRLSFSAFSATYVSYIFLTTKAKNLTFLPARTYWPIWFTFEHHIFSHIHKTKFKSQTFLLLPQVQMFPCSLQEGKVFSCLCLSTGGLPGPPSTTWPVQTCSLDPSPTTKTCSNLLT